MTRVGFVPDSGAPIARAPGLIPAMPTHHAGTPRIAFRDIPRPLLNLATHPTLRLNLFAHSRSRAFA